MGRSQSYYVRFGRRVCRRKLPKKIVAIIDENRGSANQYLGESRDLCSRFLPLELKKEKEASCLFEGVSLAWTDAQLRQKACFSSFDRFDIKRYANK